MLKIGDWNSTYDFSTAHEPIFGPIPFENERLTRNSWSLSPYSGCLPPEHTHFAPGPHGQQSHYPRLHASLANSAQMSQ